MGLFDGLKRFFGGKRSPFTKISREDGSVMLADHATADFLGSEAPPPSEASLDRIFEGATWVRVLDGGVSSGKPMGDEVLLTTRSASEIA